MDYNRLTRLPDWLATFTSLTTLYLSGNRFTELPDWLGNLTGLTELYLGNNQLAELPPWIGNLTGLANLAAKQPAHRAARLDRHPDRSR